MLLGTDWAPASKLWDVELLDWAITHGVTGLSVVAVILLYLDNRKLHDQRVRDLQKYTERLEAVQEKVHKTADDMARYLEYSIGQRRLR